MERNLQPGSGMSHGNSSVGRIPKALLCQRPLSPEQLADILDEPHTRRAWWLDLHTSAEMLTGTTIIDLQAAVGRADGGRSEGSNNTATRNGSNGQPAAAPVSSVSTCLRIDHAHTIDHGCFEMRPFEERRAEVL